MILPCPACSARFMVPDDRITPKGIKIRCPKCRFVFIMKAQQKAAGPPVSASGAIGGASGAVSGAIGGASGGASGAIGGASGGASGAIGGASGGASGAIGGDSGGASGAIGGDSGGASGSIGAVEPAKKPKPKRRAAPEGEAENLSDAELASIEDEEILDMDELAQATEQSGTAFNPNIRDEHFQVQDTSGPSVEIDNSLLAAAADHKASWTEEPTAAVDAPRIDPSQLKVSDTWIDLPSSETPTPPLGFRRPKPAAPTPPAAPAAPAPPTPAAEAEPPSPLDDAFPATVPAHKAAPESAASGALDSVAPAAPMEEAETEQWPEPAPIEPSPDAEATPSALASVIPAAPAAEAAEDDIDIDIDIDLEDEPVEATPVEQAPAGTTEPGFKIAYTLTAASAISAAELAELDEYEGLLVEERKALRKGSGAVLLTLIAIVGGVAILGALGYLGWQALNPPKRKPPSWGHLALSGLEHRVVERKGAKSIIRVEVTVRNESKDKKYKNVHVVASLVDSSGQQKCRNWAPCGPRFKNREILGLEAGEYHKALKRKTKATAFKVQLIADEQETCQILLFCGDEYDVGSDKIKVEIDRERSERLME